ncbi:TatD family hydrolase [Sunxiuqinia sp. A32]|uniref:TatD family hydrolase n=1 Tax=Sunxiuqinia sp. A32 TaxID=3461496 RepID=UPI004045F26E
MRFVDIHTHQPSFDDIVEIINHQVQDEWDPVSNKLYSAGFHPWEIGKYNSSHMIERVSELGKLPNVLAVGEFGIDRHIDTDLKQQEEVFKQQLEIAETLHKPIIIHSARSYSDIIRLKKEAKSTINWILHGYNGNEETTKQLIKHDFYFSIGASILKNPDKLVKSLSLIPLNRLFFETDISPEKIETIYIFAAKLLQANIEELKTIVYSNFKQVFRHD